MKINQIVTKEPQGGSTEHWWVDFLAAINATVLMREKHILQ